MGREDFNIKPKNIRTDWKNNLRVQNQLKDMITITIALLLNRDFFLTPLDTVFTQCKRNIKLFSYKKKVKYNTH